MNAGKLEPGCRQWPLFEALKARGSMTSLEGIKCLADAGVLTCDIRDEFGTIRNGAPAYGYELLPATRDRGKLIYRYTLRPLTLPAREQHRGNSDGTSPAPATKSDGYTAPAQRLHGRRHVKVLPELPLF